jgi:hypothetical protein
MINDWSLEETDDPHYANRRNFYKVEKWSRDGLRVELILFAGNSLDKVRRIFERTIKRRSGIRLTIRQRTRVLVNGRGCRPSNCITMRGWIVL